MTDTLSIALSGLKAQGQKLAATASNIANVSTTGRIPDSPRGAAGAGAVVYRPLQTTFVANVIGDTGAGVRAEVSARENGYSIVYDPSSAFADSEGLMAAPNIDLVEESVNLTEIKIAYKANIAVIKTQDEMLGELLDTLT